MRAVGVWRAQQFSVYSGRSREKIVARLSLPAAMPSKASQRLKSISDLLLPIHQAAITAQSAYQLAVVRATSSLIVAFCALVLSTTPLRQFEEAELLLAWLDAIAIGLVIFHFRRSRSANKRWIKSRVKAELLRQYGFIGLVFPSVVLSGHRHDLTSQFEAESRLVTAQVLKSPSLIDISTRIEDFWAARRSSIEKSSFSDLGVSRETLLLYLNRRPLRQLVWFTDAEERLEGHAHRRANRLARLYLIALGLAASKLALVLNGVQAQLAPDVSILSWQGITVFLLAALPPLLLIVTGLSAAMTAYYLNQNSRSLIHRYDMQRRRIAKWFEDLNVPWATADDQPISADAKGKEKIRNLILSFEDLMIEELIDWTHISTHDVLEIAL